MKAVVGIFIFIIFACAAFGDDALNKKIKEGSIHECMAEDFNSFIKKFYGNADFQKKHTHEVLKISFVFSDGNLYSIEGMTTVHGEIPLDDVRFPVLQSIEAIMSTGDKIKVEVESSSRSRLIVYAENSDIRSDYIFYKSPCWKLVSIEDKTL